MAKGILEAMKKLAAALIALLAFAPAAHAEVFVWKDPQYDIKVSYPDNWMRQAQLDDDLRLFVLAGAGMDHAACRLYVKHDGRFMDMPASAGQEVSSYVFDASAIQHEIYERPDTNMVQVSTFTNGASLGSAAAVMAQADFQKTWAGAVYPMHAMVVAAQYNGKHIFMSCETLASAWRYWEPVMQGIFKSVSFPAAYTPTPNGLYRPFQDEGGVYLPLNRRKDGVTIR